MSAINPPGPGAAPPGTVYLVGRVRGIPICSP